MNIRQLREIQNANNDAYRHLDKRIDYLDDKLTAGVASTMAMSGIPQAYQPNSNLAGIALGGYGNKSAIAVGVSHISENGHWVTKLQGSANTESDFGATVGVGYQW